jgi:hypothetical protein
MHGGRGLLLNGEEHTLDVQVHDLVPPIFLVHLVEFRAPGCTSVGEEDIHMIGMLLHLLDQSLNFRHLGAVCRYGVCSCAGLFVGQGIQRYNRFIASTGLPAGNEDFGAAGLKKSVKRQYQTLPNGRKRTRTLREAPGL